MSKKKTKSTLVLDKITPKLGLALQELMFTREQAFKNRYDYHTFQACLNAFTNAAEEVCVEIDRMRVEK